jgi:uncharacterized Zn finger protein (UPF0148 family)
MEKCPRCKTEMVLQKNGEWRCPDCYTSLVTRTVASAFLQELKLRKSWALTWREQ